MAGKRLMTPLCFLAGCAALRIGPPSAVRPAIACRAVLVMDSESEVYSVPFNVSAAAADIKEVLTTDAAPTVLSPEEAARAAWLAKTYGMQASPGQDTVAPAVTPELVALTAEKNDLEAALLYGYDADKVKRLAEVEALLAAEAASAAPDVEAAASLAAATPEVAALVAEKNDLDAALLYGYDADKVKRLAEVEAMLAAEGASAASEPTALSPEEAAKAAWLARNIPPSWGPGQ